MKIIERILYHTIIGGLLLISALAFIWAIAGIFNEQYEFILMALASAYGFITLGHRYLTNNWTPSIVMASNKYDTAFLPITVKDFKVTYTSPYGDTSFEGTPEQIIMHLLNLKNTGHEVQ